MLGDVRRRFEVTSVLAVLAPVLGTAIAAPIPFPSIAGYWHGLIVQLLLLLAPLDLIVHRRPPAFIGLRRRGLLGSLVPCIVLAAAYVLGLLVLAHAGIVLPHFDGARRTLGLPLVLLLYVPLWGVLEGIWVNHLVATITRWRGEERPGWASILLAALWFGVVHVVVAAVLEGGGVGSVLELPIGLFAALAGLLLRRTGNGWGFLVFWTVANF